MKKENFKTEYFEKQNAYVLILDGFSLPLNFLERERLYFIAKRTKLTGYTELVRFLREIGFSKKIDKILRRKLESMLRSFKKGVFWRTT